MKKQNSNRKKEQKQKARKQAIKKQAIINTMAVNARDNAKITCKIMEYKEMQALEAEQAGELTNKFCYEYTRKTELDKNGNPTDGQPLIVRGIRAVGAREAIRFAKKPYGFIPQYKYERDDLGDGWYREVVFCTNPLTKETTRCTCQWQRGSRFGDRIASTNAERNALLKHLPAEMKLQFLNYCVKKGFIQKTDVAPQLPENIEAVAVLQDAPEQKQEDAKSATAELARIYAIAYAMDIPATKMRLWLHKKYKTASLKTLTAETINKIINGLKSIQNNVPGKCAKPKTDILTPATLKALVEKETANEK
jgi:hypothetical protein